MGAQSMEAVECVRVKENAVEYSPSAAVLPQFAKGNMKMDKGSYEEIIDVNENILNESPVKKMVSSVKKQIKKDKEVSDASPVKNPTPKKKSPLKEKKSPKKVVSDEEMETDEVETKPSPEKVKKPLSNFFTPKSASNKKTKIPTPEVKNDPATPVAAKPKNAFSSFFSPKSGNSKRNEGGSDYDAKVMATSCHPVEDSFWSRGEATPFLALAKTLEV